jgi:hypothetical protein
MKRYGCEQLRPLLIARLAHDRRLRYVGFYIMSYLAQPALTPGLLALFVLSPVVLVDYTEGLASMPISFKMKS